MEFKKVVKLASVRLDQSTIHNHNCTLSEDSDGILKYPKIINFARKKPNIHHCVMCGEEGVPIPSQNKGVCKSCDSAFWFNGDENVVFKFCKGCKIFCVLKEFEEKPDASKCQKCRQRGSHSYFQKKSEMSSSRPNVNNFIHNDSCHSSDTNLMSDFLTKFIGQEVKKKRRYQEMEVINHLGNNSSVSLATENDYLTRFQLNSETNTVSPLTSNLFTTVAVSPIPSFISTTRLLSSRQETIHKLSASWESDHLGNDASIKQLSIVSPDGCYENTCINNNRINNNKGSIDNSNLMSNTIIASGDVECADEFRRQMESLDKTRCRSPLSNINNINNSYGNNQSMVFMDCSMNNGKENMLPCEYKSKNDKVDTVSGDQHQWQWDPSVNPLMKLAIVTAERFSST